MKKKRAGRPQAISDPADAEALKAAMNRRTLSMNRQRGDIRRAQLEERERWLRLLPLDSRQLAEEAAAAHAYANHCKRIALRAIDAICYNGPLRCELHRELKMGAP